MSGSVIKKKEIEFGFFISAAGLVERVVLLGAPISIEEENWTDARKVVELKNIYIIITGLLNSYASCAAAVVSFLQYH